MEIVVTGRKVDLEETERERIQDQMEHAARVFEQGIGRIDVEVIEEANPRNADGRFVVEATASVAGQIVRIEASAPTLANAVDDAVDRFTRRLRRLKERMITRNRQTEDVAPAPEENPSDEIVRVKQFVMKPMTLDEAVLQMDMLGHAFFFFLNADTETHNVIYRRRDGRLGLIEPA